VKSQLKHEGLKIEWRACNQGTNIRDDLCTSKEPSKREGLKRRIHISKLLSGILLAQRC